MTLKEKAAIIESELEQHPLTMRELMSRTRLSYADVCRAISSLRYGGLGVVKRYHLEPEREAS